jgi:predicted nucleotidyltransferase
MPIPYNLDMRELPINIAGLDDLCRRWSIRELGVIGSVLRADFDDASDVDVVVTFDPASTWDLFDIVRLRDELSRLFGRPVDVIEEPALRNPYMLASLRRTKRVLYAA